MTFLYVCGSLFLYFTAALLTARHLYQMENDCVGWALSWGSVWWLYWISLGIYAAVTYKKPPPPDPDEKLTKALSELDAATELMVKAQAPDYEGRCR